jgi:drug/metabolite transporter (DMT)-like permease
MYRTAQRPSDTAIGIGLIIAAGFMLAAQDSLGKYLAGEYSVAQVVWARFSVHTVLVFAWLRLAEGDLRFLRARRPGVQILRSALMLSVTVCMYTALVVVPLADATAVLFFAPVLVTLLAGPCLGERLGAHRVIGVGVGFAGVLMIVRPGFDTDPYMLLPVLAAGTLSVYLLLTRYIGAHDRQRSTLFYTTACGSLALTAVVPWYWQTPALADAGLMVAMGSLGALGHGSFVVAFARTPASVLSPFLYTQILAASLLSVGVFGDPLAGTTIAGATLLVTGGLLIWWWENRTPAGVS